MMFFFRIANVLALCLLLLGCAATYHQAGEGSAGYRDIQVKPGVYYVEYTESSSRSWDTIHRFALKRCAEIAKQKGYKYFDVVSKQENIVQLSSNIDEVIVPRVPGVVSMKGSKVEGRRVTYKIQLLNE